MELPPFNFPNPLGYFGGAKQVSDCICHQLVASRKPNLMLEIVCTKDERTIENSNARERAHGHDFSHYSSSRSFIVEPISSVCL